MLAEIASPQLESLRLDLLTAKTELALAEQTLKGLEGAGGAIPQQTLLDARMKVRQQQNALAVGRARWTALGLPVAQLDALLTDSTRARHRCRSAARSGVRSSVPTWPSARWSRRTSTSSRSRTPPASG